MSSAREKDHIRVKRLQACCYYWLMIEVIVQIPLEDFQCHRLTLRTTPLTTPAASKQIKHEDPRSVVQPQPHKAPDENSERSHAASKLESLSISLSSFRPDIFAIS